MVLDLARLKNKQSIMWPGMRGKDAGRKLTLRVCEDFVPSTVEEATLWTRCRQQEMETISMGREANVSRLICVIAEGAVKLWILKNSRQKSCSSNADFGVAELERLRTQAQFKLGRQGRKEHHWIVPNTQVPPAGDVGGEHCHGLGIVESDTVPRQSCGGAVGTQVDSSDVPLKLLDAVERDCEAFHPGPHNADVTARGRCVLVSTQVDSNEEFASQFAVQDDFGARNHGGPFWQMIFHNKD